MNGKHFAGVILAFLLLAGFGLTQLNPRLLPSADAASGQSPVFDDGGVPNYHDFVLMPPYPATVPPKQFFDALVVNTYAMAAKVKPVLFQQPCYCHCDRNFGHKSLLDCFGSTHGSQCDVCIKEAVFAYEQTNKGKTPAQIRAGIIRGDWNGVNLQPYSKTVTVH